VSIHARIRNLLSHVTRLRGRTHGSVATIFALSIVPLALAAGVGVDLGRGVVVRTRLAEALDAAGLAIGATPNISQSQAQTLAQQYFNANYNVSTTFGTPAPVTVTIANETVTVSDNVPVPTVLMKLAGLNTLNVSYASQVTWGQTKLWVSLILDNTGSMTQTDMLGYSKIAALKTAIQNLLTTLQGIAKNPGDVMVSIVPFTTGVNIGTGNKAAPWLSFAAWDAVGSGDGTYQNALGLPCTPGSPGCSWIAYDSSHTTWSGCVMNRDQDYDVQNTAPSASVAGTLFPAAPPKLYGHTPANSWSLTCPEQMIALTDISTGSGSSALSSEVSHMTSGGATSQPIGLAMGWMTLTNSDPFDPGQIPQYTTPVAIIVSDGLNTQDRWTGDGSTQDTSTDAREALVCTNMKSAGITIYAIYINLNGTQGNSAPLQNCASDPGKFFDLTTSGELITTLNQIGTQITHLRVSQ
jgi:Flp pilus assembly protein TadG